MIPWLALKYDVDGYVRWAFNSWTEDPYKQPVYNYIQGDDYMIYPGKQGPVSSIRWELLKEGVEDYELVTQLIQQNKVNREDYLKAIDLATRSEDGRKKNVNDIREALNRLIK